MARKCKRYGKNKAGRRVCRAFSGRKTSAYKSPAKYGCIGPQGPPYGRLDPRSGGAGIFKKIIRNIEAAPSQKKALCHLRQAINMRMICKANAACKLRQADKHLREARKAYAARSK